MMRGKGNELAEGEQYKERKAEREGGERVEGRQARRGAEQTKGKKTEGKNNKKKEPILDGDCILRFSSFAENGFFGSLSVLRGNSLQM